MKKFISVFIFVVLGVIVFLSTLVAFKNYKIKKAQTLLTDEVESIIPKLSYEDLDVAEINKLMEDDILTGKNATIEKAVEDYIKDLSTTMDNIVKLLNSEQLINLLTAANYQNDGPNFVESSKFITETRTTLSNYKEEILNLSKEETVMSYLTKLTKDKESADIFKNVTIKKGLNDNNIASFTEGINKIIDLLNNCYDTLSFLNRNQNNWKIENDQIIFNQASLLDEYNAYIAKIFAAKEETPTTTEETP